MIPRTSSADHLLQILATRTLELFEEGLAAVASLDASLLLMPLVKFISPTDPKWLSTLAVVEEQLTHDVLVDRYRTNEADDGLEGEDGSFSICSFWFVENLARSGRVDGELGDYASMFAGALSGDHRHFARIDDIEAAWRVVDPILKLENPERPFGYSTKSMGPDQADEIVSTGCWSPGPATK